MLDEVDILFKDEDFQPALQSLMNISPVTTQYLFVTATLPVNVYNKLIENFPDCQVIMGPGMHRTSSGLEEVHLFLKLVLWKRRKCPRSLELIFFFCFVDTC